MSYQFKNILCQMKQAQEEALVVQERNMKILGLEGFQQKHVHTISCLTCIPNFNELEKSVLFGSVRCVLFFCEAVLLLYNSREV